MQSVHSINRKTKSISRQRLVARFLYLILFIFTFSLLTSSQTIHPVTTAVQLVPPYSVYLPDYAAPGTDKMRVILTLNDITQPSYRIKLATKVEFNGRLILQTDPAFRPPPIELLPGQPVIISGAALSDYLASANLQFVGSYSRENYERTKALPEGAYKISFTAYDYNRQVPISNDGYNVFFFKKSEPPVLNLPFHKSRVEGKQPQFMTFSWSDRNTPALQGGSWSRPSYRFELFEVRPSGSNPEYITRISKPLISTTTDATSFIYGPAEPQLQDSMQYVWRVQAIDREGRDAYSNGGYSQAFLFTYGGQDPFLVNNIGSPILSGEALGERSGRWSWKVSNQSKVEGWKIQYRKQTAIGQSAAIFEWNTEELADTLLSLFNLEADNTYEARVQARVKGIYGPWSDIAIFHTQPKRVFECGQQYDQQPSGNAQPLQVATAGMIIRVGDFEMQLLKVEGSNGFFSGYGAVTTPLLGFRVNVKFTNIGINDKLVMTSGEVAALSEPLEEWIANQIEIQRDVKKIKGWRETMPDFETSTLEELHDFIQELLGIKDGIWNYTYVYSEKERAEVKGYIGEVKAAMGELGDSDHANDGAAEAKLRKTLQAAKPLLQKLSDNIGKGVLVRLGLVREKLIKDALVDIKTTIEAQLQSLGYTHFLQSKEGLAKRGPNATEYIEDDKEYLQAKKALIEKLLSQRVALEQLSTDIQRNKTDDTYLNELGEYLNSLLEQETNKNKDSKALLKEEKWQQVVKIIDKYLDVTLKATQVFQVSRFVAQNFNTQTLAIDPVKRYYLAPDGTPLDLQGFEGVLKIAAYQASPQYVIVGLESVIGGNKKTWLAREDDMGNFKGYFCEVDSTELPLQEYKVSTVSCQALLVYAVDGCSYKTLLLENWSVPANKSIAEVQQLLEAKAGNLKSADKSGAKVFIRLNFGGVIVPACTPNTGDYSGMDGVTGQSGQLIVLAPSVQDQETLKQKLGSIGIRTSVGGGYYFDQIFVTDDKLTPQQAKALDSLVDVSVEQKKNYRVLWIRLDQAGKFKSVTTHYSYDVPEDAQLILDVFRDYIDYTGKREEWKKLLDQLSSAFKELAVFVQKAKIPTKYYDPLDKDYIKNSFVLYLFKNAISTSASIMFLGPMLHLSPGIQGKMTPDIGAIEVDFAYYCGVWNGLVEQLAALPQGAGWLLDMVTNRWEARNDFIRGIQKLNKEAESAGGYCSLIGQLVDHSFNSNNAAQNAHSYGAATSQLLTFYLSVAKMGQVSKIANLFNQLDAVGGLVNLTLSPVVKLMGASTKIVLKVGGRVSIGLVKGVSNVAVAFLKGSARSLEGKVYSLSVPFLPNMMAAGEELVRNIKGIRQFVKDAEGKLLQTEDGKYVVEVEYLNEAGNTSKMHAAAEEVGEVANDLSTFIAKPLNQQLDDIANAWKAMYPEIFVERKLFEDIMGQYRYAKHLGWGHTADIADNFKAIDFYKDYSIIGNDIFANTAVSMKTTATKNIDNWLASEPIKKNIAFIKDGLSNGITSNGKNIFFNKAEIHIYMPKENVTADLVNEWLNKLKTTHPIIKFEIKSLEDFIK